MSEQANFTAMSKDFLKRLDHLGGQRAECAKCDGLIDCTNEGSGYLNGKLYHLTCLVCADCDFPNQEFCVVGNKLLCELCYKASLLVCHTCKGTITRNKSITHNNASYHADCFRCFVCQEALDGIPFHEEFSEMFCSTCYAKKKNLLCNTCQRHITTDPKTNKVELVKMGKRYFHLCCFICETCGCSLCDTPISKSGITDLDQTTLVCERCYSIDK